MNDPYILTLLAIHSLAVLTLLGIALRAMWQRDKALAEAERLRKSAVDRIHQTP